MARVTYHVVLPFIRGLDGELIALEAREVPNAGIAQARAQNRLVHVIYPH
jgi:hypothetical protein